jgi:hypothetical protein
MRESSAAMDFAQSYCNDYNIQCHNVQGDTKLLSWFPWRIFFKSKKMKQN